MPVLRLHAAEVARVMHGIELAGGRSPVAPGTLLAALDPSGNLVAVMQMKPGRRIRPIRVVGRAAP
jgi:hypothetical protein